MKSSQQMFNPSLEDYNTLKEMVVERDHDLESILGRLDSTPVRGTARSFVVVGPRGMGKTHFLLLLYHEIKQRGNLKKKYVSLKFSEEEYSIDSLAYLFIRILEELSKECESPEEIKKVEEFLEQTKEIDDREIVKRADAMLDELFNKYEKKIVLCADNLDEIFKNLSSKKTLLKHFRSILQSRDYLIILGAAPTFFKEIKEHDQPFYSFFEVVRLGSLSEAGVEELFKKLAKAKENETIMENFESFQSCIKTIVHFTGGSPRLVRMLYYVISNSEITQVADYLDNLLDELTPYYQARMAQLSPQQQKIIDTMALLDGPSTPTEIAKKGRIDRATVNAQLKKLADAGFVRLVQQKRRKWRRYDITERMFRIWREMRREKSGNRVKYLADFLKTFYTEDELRKHIEKVDDDLSCCVREGNGYDVARRAKEYEEAVKELGKVLKTYPENENAMEYSITSLAQGDPSPGFPKLRDDHLRLIMGRIMCFSLEDFNKKNFGSAREKLIPLFENKELWIKEDVYNLFLDYLVDLLKTDHNHGKEFFEMFKEELGKDFTGTFHPLDKAIEFIETRDEEILEKLFPEEREVVEGLVERVEDKHSDKK